MQSMLEDSESLRKISQKFSQDIVLTPDIIVFVANVATHGLHVKDKPIVVTQDHETTFINLCDSFNKDGPKHCQFFYTPL
jgi:exopolysaccharide biosynthesis predicted pyruvyltransferase EpsI